MIVGFRRNQKKKKNTNKPSYIIALVLFFFQAILDTVGLSPTRKTVLNILHNVSGILEPKRCVQVHVLLLAIITSYYQCPFSLCAALFHFPLKIYICVELVEFFPSFFSSLFQNVAPTLKAQRLLEEGNWDVIHHQLALSLLFV
jgi:hypothetical protein